MGAISMEGMKGVPFLSKTEYKGQVFGPRGITLLSDPTPISGMYDVI